MIYLECKDCGHRQEVNKAFFIKIIGVAFVGVGWKAWTAYLFAGTGFAFAICAAIAAGGVGILFFSNKITKWFSERHACPKCKQRNWRMVNE